MPQPETHKLALALMLAIADATPEGGAPEGVLYAGCQERGVSLDTFNEVVGLLLARGLIKRENHLLMAMPEGIEVAKVLEMALQKM